jgi:hypothetical protein
MLQWASELSRKRKARKAAVAAIAPIVERSRQRLGGISDVAWSDPYIIGFLVMLISIIARLESGKISGNAMCAVQWRAWEDITAAESNILAEQLLLLSTDGNRDFEQGCSNAAAFSTILFDSETLPEGVGLTNLSKWVSKLDDDPIDGFAQREDIAAAWVQFFDAHILAFARDGACAK